MDAAFASRVVGAGRGYKRRELDADAEYDGDEGLDLYDRKKAKGDVAAQEAAAAQRAMRDARRTDSVLDRCTLCFNSRRRPAHLLLSVGQHSYLALPERGSLARGHCVIAPLEHTPSFRAANESVYEDARNFKKCLIRMFAEQGKSCVFLETATAVGALGTHARIDCVPLDADAFSRAPLVFKQEIGEAESEWAQHHAKRLLPTGPEKSLRRSIPERFPYFHVEFGYSKGFAHVIDDEGAWKRDFGRSVVVGLLGDREADMHRRAQRDAFGAQEEAKRDFLAAWGPFDWTKELD